MWATTAQNKENWRDLEETTISLVKDGILTHIYNSILKMCSNLSNSLPAVVYISHDKYLHRDNTNRASNKVSVPSCSKVDSRSDSFAAVEAVDCGGFTPHSRW